MGRRGEIQLALSSSLQMQPPPPVFLPLRIMKKLPAFAGNYVTYEGAVCAGTFTHACTHIHTRNRAVIISLSSSRASPPGSPLSSSHPLAPSSLVSFSRLNRTGKHCKILPLLLPTITSALRLYNPRLSFFFPPPPEQLPRSYVK